MARSSASDPLDKFKWQVQIDGFTRLGFTSVSTPSLAVSTKEYPEGGRHFFPRVIVDSVSYREVTLERGVTKDSSFSKWVADLFSSVTNPTNSNAVSLTGVKTDVAKDYRRDIEIDHLDRTGKIVKKYILFNAIPVEYKPASDFASDAEDSVSIERLVVKYEAFSVLTSSQLSWYEQFALNGAKDILKKGINSIF